jgi:hypothetical protein
LCASTLLFATRILLVSKAQWRSQLGDRVGRGQPEISGKGHFRTVAIVTIIYSTYAAWNFPLVAHPSYATGKSLIRCGHTIESYKDSVQENLSWNQITRPAGELVQQYIIELSTNLIFTTGKIEFYVGHNNFRRLEGKPTKIT